MTDPYANYTRKDVKSPKRLLKAIHDFKVDLVMATETFPSASEAGIKYNREARDYFKRSIEGNPIYDSIARKTEDAAWQFEARGKYVKPKLTPEEEKFLASPKYKRYEKMMDKSEDAEKKEQERIRKVLKEYPEDEPRFVKTEKGIVTLYPSKNVTKEESEIFRNAEMAIWDRKSDFFGKKSESEDLPIITIDGAIYDAFNYYPDAHEKIFDKFNKRLDGLGFACERWDASTIIFYRKVS